MSAADVEVFLYLPYRLALPAGDYPTPAVGGVVSISDVTLSDPSAGERGEASRAASIFTTDPVASRDDVLGDQIKEADRLLRRVNHLLRWYRIVAGQPTTLEVTRAQVGRFMFDPVEQSGGSNWSAAADLVYEDASPPESPTRTPEERAIALRSGLARRAEPDVATLNLLDAEYAVSVGRFREAVLLSWSVIDSSFVRTFKDLVDQRLPAEWPDGRNFLKGYDFGLRQKMTSGLRLVAGRSLYEEPNNFWTQLSSSYAARNAIIHEGRVATEDQAMTAIAVAKRMVAITLELNSTLTPPASAFAAP